MSAFDAIRRYERLLADHLLDALQSMKDIKVWGITSPPDRDRRFPTVSITKSGIEPVQLARRLAENGIFVWHGNNYALPLTERLGLEPDGIVRIGLTHYNTIEEINRLLDVLA